MAPALVTKNNKSGRPVSDKPTRLQKYSAPALEKGLDIIEFLSQRPQEEFSHADIAAGVGRSKNEIFRMMVVLEERGYIFRSDTDLFKLTNKSEAFLPGVLDDGALLAVSGPLLTNLSNETGLSSHLWALVDGAMEVVFTAHAVGSFQVSLSEGHRQSLLGATVGPCFLSSQQDQGSVEAFLNKIGEFPSRDDLTAFYDRVVQCRSGHICLAPNLANEDIWETSFPVKVGVEGPVVGVISAALLKAQSDTDEAVEAANALRKTAIAMSVCLELLNGRKHLSD